MIYVFLFFAISLVLFLIFETRGNALKSFFFKATTSFAYTLFAIIIFMNRATLPSSMDSLSQSFVQYSGHVLAGLVCGIIGDLILALRPMAKAEKEQEVIFAGMVAFGLGHLFYIISIIALAGLYHQAILVSLAISAIIIIAGKLSGMQFRKLLIPTALYSFLLLLFAAEAFYGYLHSEKNPFWITLVVSAVLFVLSDLMLSLIYAGPKEKIKGITQKVVAVISLVLYYSAQMGIAFTFYLFEN